jgi:hypothetical protein
MSQAVYGKEYDDSWQSKIKVHLQGTEVAGHWKCYEMCDSCAEGYTTTVPSSCGTITGLSLNVEGTALHLTPLFKLYVYENICNTISLQLCVKFTSVVQLQATCVPQVNLLWATNTPTENSFCSRALTGCLWRCGGPTSYHTKRYCCIENFTV